MKIFRYYRKNDTMIIERWSWRKRRWVYYLEEYFPSWYEPVERFFGTITKENYVIWKKKC